MSTEWLSDHEPPLKAGSCVLARPECAEVVQRTLLHFNSQRYELVSWCVMPNHVHLLVAPYDGYPLSKLVHSWKSFSSNQINRVLGTSGPIWQRDYFDHLVRSQDHLIDIVDYIHLNPVAAGLCKTAWDWPYSSAGIKFGTSCRYRFMPKPSWSGREIRQGKNLPHLEVEGSTYFITWRLWDAVVRQRENMPSTESV